MLMKWRETAIVAGVLIVAIAVLSLWSYWHGRRAGVVASQHQNVTHEIQELDDEQAKIGEAVHALDTDSLRVHILDLSRRVHEEAARVSK